MPSTISHSFTPRTAIAPEDPAVRLIVFALRRMGAFGLADATASHAFMTAFGKDFRRPLVLQRAWVADLSAVATQSIQIAPWCCPRLTASEGVLVDVLHRTAGDPAGAALLLGDLLGTRDPGRPLSAGAALAGAFADLGLPIGADL